MEGCGGVEIAKRKAEKERNKERRNFEKVRAEYSHPSPVSILPCSSLICDSFLITSLE